MKSVLIITVGVVVLFTGMSAYPGLIESTVFDFLGFFLIVPVLCLWFLFVGISAMRELAQRKPLRSAVAVQAVVFGGIGFSLAVVGIPFRIGFALSRSGLERFRESIKTSDQHIASPMWVGIYRVDRYATDLRGGLFIRTCTGADLIDTISYGFAFRPNREGTPFGRANYNLVPVSEEWQVFSVSNDF